jgi:hypothetical protein
MGFHPKRVLLNKPISGEALVLSSYWGGYLLVRVDGALSFSTCPRHWLNDVVVASPMELQG